VIQRCPHCSLDFQLYGSPADGEHCKNCGLSILTKSTRAQAGADSLALGRFFVNLKTLLFHPTQFFSENAELLVQDGNLISALTFAVLVQWFAAFFNFIWKLLIGTAVEDSVNDLVKMAEVMVDTGDGGGSTLLGFRHQAMNLFFGGSSVILSPFLTIFQIAASGIVLFIALKLFVRDQPDRKISYATTLKILSYGTAPYVFCLIPGIGMLVAYIYSFFVILIGFREVFKTTSGRATLVLIFPGLLLLAFIFILVVLAVGMGLSILKVFL